MKKNEKTNIKKKQHKTKQNKTNNKTKTKTNKNPKNINHMIEYRKQEYYEKTQK